MSNFEDVSGVLHGLLSEMKDVSNVFHPGRDILEDLSCRITSLGTYLDTEREARQ